MSERAYTPPLNDALGKSERISRRLARGSVTVRRRRSTTQTNRRHKQRRDTYRSRSQRKNSVDVESSSLDEDIHHQGLKRRQRRRKSSDHWDRRRHSQSSTSSTSADTNSESTLYDDGSSSDTDVGSVRCRKRKHSRMKKRKRRSSRSPSRKGRGMMSSTDSDFLTKLMKLVDRKGNAFEGAQNVIPEFDRNASFVNNKGKHSVRCYNCNETGHYMRTCTKSLVRCDKCSNIGHDARQCCQNKILSQQAVQPEGRENDKSVNQRVLHITKDNKEMLNSKYFKNVILNGTPRSGYIDFGSQCTLVKCQVAEGLNMVLDKTGLPVINGFGLGSVIPLGRVTVTLEVDLVRADVDAYVVTDDLLSTDVLIGQSLTELPSVTVYKTSTQLTLYCDDTKLNRVTLLSSSDIIVQGLQHIRVRMREGDYTGLLFVSGYLCLKENNEYCILQGAYEFLSGKGQILLVNFSEKTLEYFGRQSYRSGNNIAWKRLP